MAYYKMNYRLCTIPFPCGGEGVLKGKWGRPESVHSPGDCLIKEPLMLLRGESLGGGTEGYCQGASSAYLLGLMALEFSDS